MAARALVGRHSAAHLFFVCGRGSAHPAGELERDPLPRSHRKSGRTQHSLHYLLFGVWERFDTLWYLHIAALGHDRPDAIVFFPLYPGLIKVASLLIPPVAAALLISTVAALFLLWGLQELLLKDHSADFVDKTILVAAVWPASFIFFAGTRSRCSAP